jgi:DNA-binding SARP family transcriptional activator/TolB-like protein/Tfp pilus assembly protein PilF
MQGTGRISLRVLGGFAIAIDAAPPCELRISSRKACAMLAYLAMHPDRRASREHLATFFWGDRREEHARQSLRQCLLSLRRDLAKAPVEILVVDSNTVGLQTSNLTIDAAELMALAESSEMSDIEHAASLYRGEFLSEFNLGEPFDGWVRKTRSQLDSAAANVFQTCATLAEARGDGKQAIRAVERLIALDALREDWQRLALRIYARYQSRESAAAHADALVTLLKTELGVDPDPATMDVIDGMRRDATPLAPVLSANVWLKGGERPSAASDVAPSSASFSSPSPPRPLSSGQLSASVSFDNATRGVESAIPAQSFGAFVARSYARLTRWSLGTVSSVAVAALISISAIGLMFAGGKTAQRSGSVPAIKTAEGSLVAIRSASVDGAKAVGKPLSAPGLVPIVVLPFTADDGVDGPNQKVADALTDDLITTLSRFANMRVISRQTAFTYKGHPVDVATVGAELGVRYAVEGSYRTVGDKLAINFELVDTADRLQVWSDRVEWDGSDRATVQDEIATRIARELKTGVTIAEGERSGDNHAQEPDVDALIMQGWAYQYRGPSRANLANELALFEEALRREPDLQPALVGVAMALTTAVLSSLADDPQRNLDRANELLDRAIEKAPNAYQVYYWKGVLYAASGDYEGALRSLSKCIDINPSATYAHAEIAKVLTRLGRPQEGLDYIQYAIRLSPKDPAIGLFYVTAGEAELELRHDQAAVEWFRRAIVAQPRNPSGYLSLAATYALMGDTRSAAKYWGDFRELSAPGSRDQLIARLKSDLPAGVRDTRSRLDKGLRLVPTS